MNIKIQPFLISTVIFCLLFTPNNGNAFAISSNGSEKIPATITNETKRDIILVIDTTASMTYETSGGSSGVDPGDDPSVCNANNTCEPFQTIKTAVSEFVDTLTFPNDQIGIVALTSQTPDGTRTPVVVLPLNTDKATVKAAIDNLKVYQPPVCTYGPPVSPSLGPCLNYSNNSYLGNDCPVYRRGYDLVLGTADDATRDVSSCTSSDIGSSIKLAGSLFFQSEARQNSQHIVITINTKPADASESTSTNPSGYCPINTWNDITTPSSARNPFCRDASASTRHYASDTNYDADDFARDMADFAKDPINGVGAKIYTIGLGHLIQHSAVGDADAGEKLLQYIANTAGGSYANHGAYYFAPSSDSLTSIFSLINENTICTSPVVTNTNDSGTGSLRQAIFEACPEGTITFDSSISGQTIHLASELVIAKSLTIDASNLTANIMISGDSNDDGTSDVHLINIYAPTNSVNILGVDFKDGKSTTSLESGGINNSGTLLIQNCMFSGNTGDQGGAIHNNAQLTVDNCKFTGNSASEGGAILNNIDATATIKNSTFTHNIATGPNSSGGGISNLGNLTIKASTISGNSATVGGGALTNALNGNASIINSTITENSSADGGGIINSDSASLTLNNTTISGNDGGGLYILNGSVYLKNSILANSTSKPDCYKIGGNINTNLNLLIEANGINAETCGTPLFSIDPGLDTLANNGGPTQTIALLSNSVAINAGDDLTCELTDQKSTTRPQGQHCDIGSYEFEYKDAPSVLSVTRDAKSPNNAANVSFTVAFSTPVTGVDKDDFSLDTTGLINASISNVSGLASTYTITVNTGVGSGTLHLNVIDNDTIEIGNSTPLGGPGIDNGNFTTGETYIIAKQYPILAAPVISPLQRKLITNDSTPTLQWANNPQAREYEIVVISNNISILSETITSPFFKLETPLPDGIYYWHVRAFNRNLQPGKFSTTQSFTVDTTPPTAPIPLNPSDGTTSRGVLTFRWSMISWASNYEIQVDDDPDFSSSTVDKYTGRSSFLQTRSLPTGLYYWHVRAKDAAGNWGDWSTTFTINITR